MDFNNKNGFNFTFMYRFIKEEFRYASKIFFPILIPYFRGLPIHGFLRLISRSASVSCKLVPPFLVSTHCPFPNMIQLERVTIPISF